MDTISAKPGQATLMIVEDEALVAEALRDVLEEAGYHVLNLTDRHAEALAVARTSRPDLALVNIQLGGRDDGIGLAESLKTMGIPVMFISGQISRARSRQTVAIASMPKPYDAAEMAVAVTYLLARLRGQTPLSMPAGLEVFDGDSSILTPT